MAKSSLKRFDVWAEGFMATGESGGATRLGSVEAETFAEAVKKIAERSNSKSLFDLKRLTFWGCKLFDTEAKARRTFG